MLTALRLLPVALRLALRFNIKFWSPTSMTKGFHGVIAPVISVSSSTRSMFATGRTPSWRTQATGHQTSRRCPRFWGFTGSRTIDEAAHPYDYKFLFLPTSSSKARSMNSWSRDHNQSCLCICYQLTDYCNTLLAEQPKLTTAPLQRDRTLWPDWSLELDITITSLQLSSLFTGFRCHSELHTICVFSCTLLILDAVQRISLNWSLQHPSCHFVVQHAANNMKCHEQNWSLENERFHLLVQLTGSWSSWLAGSYPWST